MIEESSYDAIDKRREYAILRSMMAVERSSFEAHWMELANFVKPRRSRLFGSERNRGEKRNQKILDSTATYCLEILRSGMLAGLTSPASPWLQYGLGDPDLEKYLPVKVWLKQVTERVLLMFEKSNMYSILPTTYGDEAQFATAAMGLFDDTADLMRGYSYPIGSYYCGMDETGRVNTFMRDSQMTVRQIVKSFGLIPGTRTINWSNISEPVHRAWDKGNYEQYFEVCNIITPNEDYDARKFKSKYKKFASCWFETGNAGKFLNESGYDEFPIFIYRWETTGEDTYGTESPGMIALADVKQLQLGEKRSLQAIEKMVNPPVEAPTSMRNTGVNGLPGGTNYVDVSGPRGGIRSIYEVNFGIDKLEAKQTGIRQRIHQDYFTDLFLMMASSDRTEITAREVAERHEEKLLAVGPVVLRNSSESLAPTAFRSFAMGARAGFFPPPPKEIQGKELSVTFTSMMHQAQKLVGINGHERFMSNLVQVGQYFPEALAKVRIFTFVDRHADMLGVDPSVLNTDEEAQAIVDKHNQAIAAQQAAELMKQGSGIAANLSRTNIGGDNALAQLNRAAGGQQ